MLNTFDLESCTYIKFFTGNYFIEKIIPVLKYRKISTIQGNSPADELVMQ
jgi:hypothetical protein